MSTIANAGSEPEGAELTGRTVGAGRGRTMLVIGAALLGGVLGGTGGFAVAAGPWHGGWHHHGPRLERIQAVVRRSLDAVGATTIQEDKIHDIVAAAFTQIAPDPAKHQALRKQMIDLLRAPTLDRAAIEKLRAGQIAELDAKSKTLVGAILDSADQLSPDQRAKLADRLEEMAQRHGGMQRQDSDWRDGKAHDPLNGGPSPDQGSDHAPD